MRAAMTVKLQRNTLATTSTNADRNELQQIKYYKTLDINA